MRKIQLAVTLFIILMNISFSQSENWKTLKVKRELNSIKFLTNTNALVFGGDYSYKSTDGGETWSPPVKMNVNVGIPSGSGFVSYDEIFFIDSLYGWACQSNKNILKTMNGGISWGSINTNFNDYQFYCVKFINRQTGWVAGCTGSSSIGVIAKTTNGGTSWVIAATGLRSIVNSLCIIDENTGYFTYGAGSDSIGFTLNGWQTVQYKKVGNGNQSLRVLFNNTTNGWVLGLGYVARTTNGGQNWNTNTYSYNGEPLNIYFVNNYTGWIINMNGNVNKSTNGGINWSYAGSYSENTVNRSLHDVYFINPNTGWIATVDGSILKSTNGGINWVKVVGDSPVNFINSLDFIDNNSGWCGGYDGIWKTTNRGYNWSQAISNVQVYTLDFIDYQTGYACLSSGNVIKTTNEGSNGYSITNDSNKDRKVFFLNANTGYICGLSGAIVKTTNAGLNWIAQNSNTTKKLNDVAFTDYNNGYIACDSGYILKTTNSGNNWILLYPQYNRNYNALHFINVNTGFVTGNYLGSNIYPITTRVVIKTTNAGNTWFESLSESTAGYNFYTDIYFLNSEVGWLVVDNSGWGYISKTTNGGANWLQAYGPVGNGPERRGGLYCITSSGEENCIAAGENGVILSTSQPIGIQTVSNEVPKKFILNQNYPNPFNPQTKIKFDVPSNVKGQMSNVKLVIFDLMGREITTLVNEELKPGTYEADWDGSGYSSGVYFYKLVVGDPSTTPEAVNSSGRGFVETKKMVLMK